MTPELLATRRELLLARASLQRARLLRDVAALRTSVQAIPSLICSQAVGALEAIGLDARPSANRARSWIAWAVVALQVLRAVKSLRRQPR
jgi:hypothetical protein